MSSITVRLAVLGSCLAVCAHLQGQDPELCRLAAVGMPVDVKTGKPLPFPKDFERDENGDPKWVWLAVDGFQPLSRPEVGAPPANSSPARFMQRFHVLAHHQASGKEPKAKAERFQGTYWLLAENPNKPYGWVPEDLLVRDNNALRVPATTILRKGMLVTRIQDAGKNDAKIYAWGTPRGPGRKRGPYGPANLFFIYGEADPERYGRKGEEPHVLIGTSMSFDASASGVRDRDENDSDLPEAIVKGWVPKQRILFWNTREAIEWDRPSTLPSAKPRRTTPAVVFRSPQDAFEALNRNEDKAAHTNALIVERFQEDGTSVPFQPHHARYPVLEYFSSDAYPQNYRGNRILKIAALSGFGQSPAGPGQFQADVGPELQRILQRHGVSIEKLREIQGAQVHSEGYVWKKAVGDKPVRQVRSMYLLSHRNIEDLIRIMEPLVLRSNDALETKTTLRDLLVGIIKQVTNDPIDEDRSFEEIVLKQHGIEAMSPLLKMRLHDGVQLRASPQHLEDIRLCMNKLHDILDGKARTWTPRTRTVGDVTLRYYEGGLATRLDRSWTFPENRLKWYWIDAEEEIP